MTGQPDSPSRIAFDFLPMNHVVHKERLEERITSLIAAAVQAESRKLLERLQGFLEVDKDTSEPLPEAESEWNEAINYAYKRLLDSEQQKLGGYGQPEPETQT